MSRKTSVKKPKDPNAPKAPLSSYFIFMNERRSILRDENKDLKLTEISKLISAEWAALSEDEKAKYVSKAAELKGKYNTNLTEYKKTDEYHSFQKKLDTWKATKKDIESAKGNTTSADGKVKKISMPRKPKDDKAPKKSPTSYFLFAQEVRDQIKTDNPELKMTEIAKVIGAKWKELSDDQKKPYTVEAARLKEEYKKKMEKYVNCDSAKEYQQKLEGWKEECNRRKRAAAVKQSKADAKVKASSKAKAKAKGKGKAKGKVSKKKKFESSSDDDSDDSSSESESGSSSSSSSDSSSSGSESESE
mmetsp:Transcript_67027/g.106585  ORF Transcript_67027/g.106585 Transcript_67027/m.106585 type:complete len:304 (-) Transcript_67027:155-1066(-)